MSVCRFLIIRLEKCLLRESLVKAARSAERKVMVLVVQRHRCVLEQAYHKPSFNSPMPMPQYTSAAI